MKSIRKFVYAAALTFSAFNFAPSLASAQDAGGTFTLAHEVHWQNAVVPAGKYRFTIESTGPAEMLTLRRVSGTGMGFMLIATATEDSQPSEVSQLVLVSRSGESFVSTMQLPEFGVTLHFVVPAETRQVAQAGAPSTASTVR